MSNANKADALRAVLSAILEAVEAAGTMGAPGGVLYAGMMSSGCTLQRFNEFMDAMLNTGLLVKSGECYTKGAKADVWMESYKARQGATA